MLTKDKLIVLWLAFTATVCGSDFKNEFSEGNGAVYTEDAVIVDGKRLDVTFVYL